jgi:hypothetical protein
VCTRTSNTGPSADWTGAAAVMEYAGAGVEIDSGRFASVLEASASTWSSVACSRVSVQIKGETVSREVGFDWSAGSNSRGNNNVVVFRNDTPEDPLDAWLYQLGALALTTVTYLPSSGALLDADIELNDAANAFTACNPDACTVDTDLENTLTHELGHVIGLDHPDDPTATMAASAPRGETAKRTLNDDDETAVCFVYPETGSVAECYGVERQDPPSVRFTEGCASAPASSAWLAFLAGAYNLATRRRRMA